MTEIKTEHTFGEWLALAIVAIILGLSLAALNVALDAYVAIKLWSWFIVPQFGLVPLTLHGAVGISFIVALTSHQNRQKTPLSENLSYMLMTPIILLFVGWVIKTFF